MASRLEKSNNVSDDNNIAARLISLHKTTNITKIKGWRKKKFDLGANKDDSEDSSSISESQNKSDGLDSLDEYVMNMDKLDVTTKLPRNSNLLDDLFKKFVNPDEMATESNTDRDEVINENMSVVENDIEDKQASVTVNITDSDFQKSAFISKSLDDFLSKEEGIQKMKKRTSDTPVTVMRNASTTRNEFLFPKRFKSLENTKRLRLVTRVLVDEHGNKPRTVAEKRRILEGVAKSKRIKMAEQESKKDIELRMCVKKENNFQSKVKKSPQNLRKSFSKSVTDVTNDLNNEVNIATINAVEEETKTSLPSIKKRLPSSSLKQKTIFEKINQMRHPHLNTSKLKQKRPFPNSMRQKIKEKLQKLSKTSRNKKALQEAVYIKPLKKRILFEFMVLLKDSEIVTYSQDSDLSKKVGMVLFLGVGRCLYQEQFENLEMLRENNNIIENNYAKFAASAVLDRKKENTVTRVLVPVVSTKLLTFMNRYPIISAHYKNFLINKFNINVPSSLSLQCDTENSSNTTKSLNVPNILDNDIDCVGDDISFQNESPNHDDAFQAQRHSPVINASQKVGFLLNENQVNDDNFLEKIEMTSNNQQDETITNSQPFENSSNSSIDKTLNAGLEQDTVDSSENDDETLDSYLKRTTTGENSINGKTLETDLEKNTGESSKNDTPLNTDLKTNVNLSSKDIQENRVLKNGRIVHKDKRMSKLNNELRRLNHAFIEVEDNDERLEKTIGKDMFPEESSKKSKLAKVESEFHQTVMKSKEDILLLSTFSERSSRRRKLPKKLEDTFLLNPSTVMKTRSQMRRIPKSLKTAPEVRAVSPKQLVKVLPVVENSKIDPIFTNSKNLPPRVIQPDYPVGCAWFEKSISFQPKPMTDWYNNDLESENSKDLFENETVAMKTSNSVEKPNDYLVSKDFEELWKNEIIAIRTSKSILKSNVMNDINGIKNNLNRFNNSSSKKEPDIFENCDIISTNIYKKPELIIFDGKYPVLSLKRIDFHDKKIFCMDHKTYDCRCMDSTDNSLKYKSLAEKMAAFSVNKLDFECVKSENQDLEDIMSVDVDLSEINNQEYKLNEPCAEVGTVMPRIESVRTLRHEDFYKNEMPDNICDNGDSDMATITRIDTPTSSSAINEEVAQLTWVKSFPSVSKSSSESTIKYSNCTQIDSKCSIRFFCVSLKYEFAFIKFFGELNKLAGVSADGSSDNFGVVICYTVLESMLKESEQKQQCVHQPLVKTNYDHKKFNNLPFGIYAVERTILFGPYDINEFHRLYPFIFSSNQKEDTVKIGTTSAMQVCFKHHRYLSDSKSDGAVGYWWSAVCNGIIQNRQLFDKLNTQQIATNLKPSDYLLRPLKPTVNDDVNLPVPEEPHITGVLNNDNLKMIKIGSATPGFVKVQDLLKSFSVNNRTSDTTIKQNMVEETTSKDLATISSINLDNPTGLNQNSTSVNKKCNKTDPLPKENSPRQISLQIVKSVTTDTPINRKTSDVLQEVKDRGNTVVNDSDVKWIEPKMQQSLKEKFKPYEPVLLYVQPSGELIMFPLNRIQKSGDVASVKNDRRHIRRFHITIPHQQIDDSNSNDVEFSSKNMESNLTLNFQNSALMVVDSSNLIFVPNGHIFSKDSLSKKSTSVGYCLSTSINTDKMNSRFLSYLQRVISLVAPIDAKETELPSKSIEIIDLEDDSTDNPEVTVVLDSQFPVVDVASANQPLKKYTNTKNPSTLVNPGFKHDYCRLIKPSNGYIPITSALLEKKVCAAPNVNEKQLKVCPTSLLPEKKVDAATSVNEKQLKVYSKQKSNLLSVLKPQNSVTKSQPQDPVDKTVSVKKSTVEETSQTSDISIEHCKVVDPTRYLQANQSPGTLKSVLVKLVIKGGLNANGTSNYESVVSELNKMVNNKFKQSSPEKKAICSKDVSSSVTVTSVTVTSDISIVPSSSGTVSSSSGMVAYSSGNVPSSSDAVPSSSGTVLSSSSALLSSSGTVTLGTVFFGSKAVKLDTPILWDSTLRRFHVGASKGAAVKEQSNATIVSSSVQDAPRTFTATSIVPVIDISDIPRSSNINITEIKQTPNAETVDLTCEDSDESNSNGNIDIDMSCVTSDVNELDINESNSNGNVDVDMSRVTSDVNELDIDINESNSNGNVNVDMSRVTSDVNELDIDIDELNSNGNVDVSMPCITSEVNELDIEVNTRVDCDEATVSVNEDSMCSEDSSMSILSIGKPVISDANIINLEYQDVILPEVNLNDITKKCINTEGNLEGHVDKSLVDNEELKLVSNIDSLPNLELYGIHFIDDT